MYFFISIIFLFYIGSTVGWVLELFYRNLHPETDTWVNPGLCKGPYLPIYGYGLCILYLLTELDVFRFVENRLLHSAAQLLLIAACMTLLEYIIGAYCLRVLKVRFWDYSNMKGNLHGIICPQFSAVWAVLGFVYTEFLHPPVRSALEWLSSNLAFSFFIGIFFGIFLLDMANALEITKKLRLFAEEYQLVLKYEAIKRHIRSSYRSTTKKYHFFSPFQGVRSLNEHLKEMYITREKTFKNRK